MPGCQIVTNMEEVSECLAYRDTGQKPPEYITLTSPTFTNNPYILHTPFAALRYIYIYLDMYTLCCIQTNDVWKLDGVAQLVTERSPASATPSQKLSFDHLSTLR